jgi:hypothetical protein
MSQQEQKQPQRPTSNGDLIDAVAGVATGIGRVGYGLLSFGLDLLPPQSRRHMYNAIHELSYGFARLPRDFAEIAGSEIERWAGADDAPVAQPTTTPAVQKRYQAVPATLGAALNANPAPAAEPPAPAEPSVSRVPTGISISHIEYDPPGRDVDGEYVLIVNNAHQAVALTGWVLTDGDARHTFTFPAFTLAAGGTVKVWTKRGQASASDLYWGSRTAIWNNDGDTGTLKTDDGVTVSVFAYEGNRKKR